MKLKSYIGQVYKTFKVIEDLGSILLNVNSKIKRNCVLVSCVECGYKKSGLISNFQKGLSCKCKKSSKNYEGKIFGNFKVINDLGYKLGVSSKKEYRYLICECTDCGRSCEGMVQSFRKSYIKCDCTIGIRSIEHWKRINRIYIGMKARCLNKNAKKYEIYGGKGITVCDEWIDSCRPFAEWSLKNGYKENLTIDRIDSSLGYSPANCRWVTLEDNSRYTKRSTPINKILEIKELLKKGHKRRDISVLVGISYDVISNIDKGIRWADVI